MQIESTIVERATLAAIGRSNIRELVLRNTHLHALASLLRGPLPRLEKLTLDDENLGDAVAEALIDSALRVQLTLGEHRFSDAMLARVRERFPT